MAASLPPSPPRRLAPHSTPKRGLSIAALGRSRAACFRRSGLGPPPYFTRVITLAPVTAGPPFVAGAFPPGRPPQSGPSPPGGLAAKSAPPPTSPAPQNYPPLTAPPARGPPLPRPAT